MIANDWTCAEDGSLNQPWAELVEALDTAWAKAAEREERYDKAHLKREWHKALCVWRVANKKQGRPSETVSSLLEDPQDYMQSGSNRQRKGVVHSDASHEANRNGDDEVDSNNRLRNRTNKSAHLDEQRVQHAMTGNGTARDLINEVKENAGFYVMSECIDDPTTKEHIRSIEEGIVRNKDEQEC